MTICQLTKISTTTTVLISAVIRTTFPRKERFMLSLDLEIGNKDKRVFTLGTMKKACNFVRESKMSSTFFTKNVKKIKDVP